MIELIECSIFKISKFSKKYEKTSSISGFSMSLATQLMLVCHCSVHFTSITLVKVKYDVMALPVYLIIP